MDPAQVTAAVSNALFYKQRNSFWQMLCYLMSDYQGQKVHTFLPPDTFRKICVQLHRLIESYMVVQVGNDDRALQSNANLLYQIYFVLLKNIRAHKTITRMTVDEHPDVLMALHKIYSHLRQLNAGPMPLFAHHFD
jgi:hypothetical protein